MGRAFLTHKAKDDLKALIEACTDYRQASVAAYPGWCGNCYVFGDGTVCAPDESDEEIIVTFEPNPKFTPVGSRKKWNAKVGRVVTNQSIPLFLVAYAFVGPLLRFVPQGNLNPQIELVGPPETGKTSIAVLAASVWAGDPNNDAGGGENWNVTLGGVDAVKVAHSDTLLLLDEANLVGANNREQGQLLHKAVFRIAASGGRRRWDGNGPAHTTRVALLSTSNEPLRRLIQTSRSVAAAINSRMVTIPIDEGREFGAFDSLPGACADIKEASKRLRLACSKNYGRAGRHFVKKLVRAAFTDEAALVSKIERYTAEFIEALDRHERMDGSSERVRQAFAITYAAGRLAREWRLIPGEWGSLKVNLQDVYATVQGKLDNKQAGQSALKTIRDYVRRNKDDLIHMETLPRPHKYKRFKQSAGFLLEREGRRDVLIPTERFKSEFEDHRGLMTELRSVGLAKTEKGRKPKLSVKAPKKLCDKGRVYWIRLT